MREKLRVYVGIDPGQSGGIAYVSENFGVGSAYAMPKTVADIADLLGRIKLEYNVVKCAIEKVHSMPKQGVVSSFKFGRNFGQLEGVLAALEIPHEEVPPRSWQSRLGCLSGGDKNVTKAHAQRMFPGALVTSAEGKESNKITHAVADALLLAEYCRKTTLTGA